ncbi:conserved protein of unknown function [Rhodovastum atsumiense]|uniref:Uncharacterized protein n=1 Tax=Rhodovastum atsumiense TaxID=504468 RepID=A0A5M6J548_9PROT|nr:hypothetical protein [Rhodovastum atsumiense]KAA5614728.1 hypothetical protein F1189_00955 [Rhodovastum atsumiense]CAH2599733.1 conserved protein of unknown function [Rhodovastum atsumiense]
MPGTDRLGFNRDEEQQEADRQTSSLAGLAVALLIVVVSLLVVQRLATKAAIEDCLIAGRANCDLMLTGER